MVRYRHKILLKYFLTNLIIFINPSNLPSTDESCYFYLHKGKWNTEELSSFPRTTQNNHSYWMGIYVYVSIFIWISIHIHTELYIYIYILCRYIYIIWIYVCIVYIWIYIYTVYICECMYIFIYKSVSVWVLPGPRWNAM